MANNTLVASAGALLLACVVYLYPSFAANGSNIDKEDSLIAKVAALEKTVAELRQQVHNDRMTSTLAGHYWVEQSRILAGEQAEKSEDVAWRLSALVDSEPDEQGIGPKCTIVAV